MRLTFEQRCRLLSFWAGLMALTYRLPDYILVDFHHGIDLEFSRSNNESDVSQPKMMRLPRNEKQTYRLNSRPSNVTIRFGIYHDLHLEFSRSNV